MESRPSIDPEEATARIAEHPFWYHRIEVAPGVVTPGTHDSPRALMDLDLMGLPADCSGIRALDIGCRDGFFSFELERRGATVVGIDYAPPDRTGFSIASELVGSKTTYLVDNVYDLHPDKHGVFDLVLFLGVLYHLRNPMLALDRIRAVTKTGGTLLVETQLCVDPELQSSNTPLMEFFPRAALHGDHTNKWGPNAAGLRAIVEEAQFSVVKDLTKHHRGYVAANASDDEVLAQYRDLDGSAGVFRHR